MNGRKMPLNSAQLKTDLDANGFDIKNEKYPKATVAELAAETLARSSGDTANATLISRKQDALVSGTNIKTVNGQSLLGSGNIVVQGGGTPEDYNTVKSNAETGATHAAVTSGNPHGVTYQNIGGTKPSYTADEVGALASGGTAVNSLSLGGVAAASYALAADVPSVVSPSSSAAEGAAAGAKATGTALAGKVSLIGDTMTGPLRVDYDEDAVTGADISKEGFYIVKDGDTMFASADSGNVLAAGDVTVNGKVVVGENDYDDGTMYGNGTITRESENGETVINLPDDGQSHDFPTKTSELTNDSGFVTADAIPVPTRVKNTDDTCRIDGEGNVYTVSKNTRGTPVATGYKAGTYTFASFNGGVSTKWICGSDANWLTYNLSTGYLYNGNVQVLLDKNIDLSVDWTKLTKDGVVVGTADNPIIIQGSSYTQSIVFYPQGEYANEANNARLAREYPIKSLTVTSGAATAKDSTINTITPTATTTISPPTAKTIGARDWLVVVTQGATAYGVTFSGSFVAESGFSWPTMEATKTYVFSFTEVSANKYLASVKEVANV